MKVSIISLAIALTSALVAAVPQAEGFISDTELARRQFAQPPGFDTDVPCRKKCVGKCRTLQQVLTAKCDGDQVTCTCQPSPP
ncbi:hypothetical protein LX32DRAFT_646074 [Colletotrichum zoysiae]|uniref:Uncharacterized protein n=1 Tax=Colletotrichum zoysiae TaxID=1216348 RepID=A0AAD9H4A8_9PEZI|nr:hypothetical protein LX32DRAFT_646074 [Colletotrichum zoysiae]